METFCHMAIKCSLLISIQSLMSLCLGKRKEKKKNKEMFGDGKVRLTGIESD